MKFVAVVLSVLFLVSCNKKEGSPINTTTPPDLGTYETCENVDGISAKTKVFLNEISMAGTITFFASTDCPTGQELFSETDIYSYSRNGTSFSLTMESVSFALYNSTIVSQFNTQSFCGYSDWVINVPKRAAGRNCDGYMVSVGDQSSLSMYKSKGKLVISDAGEKSSYTKVAGLEFNDVGQTAPNGSYVYYDGSRGVHLLLSSPNFQMVIFNQANKRYYIKNGTYTSANNEIVFSTVVNTPDCDTDEGTPVTRGFNSSSISLAMDSVETDTWLMEKINFTNNQFRDSYLQAGYTQSCP